MALHQLDQTKAELACLYVSPAHENQGIGHEFNGHEPHQHPRGARFHQLRFHQSDPHD